MHNTGNMEILRRPLSLLAACVILGTVELASAQYAKTLSCSSPKIEWIWRTVRPKNNAIASPSTCITACNEQAYYPPLNAVVNNTHCACGIQPPDFKGVYTNNTACTAAQRAGKAVTVVYNSGDPTAECRLVKPQIHVDPYWTLGKCMSRHPITHIPVQELNVPYPHCPNKLGELDSTFKKDSWCTIGWEWIVKMRAGCYGIASVSPQQWRYGLVKWRVSATCDPYVRMGPVLKSDYGRILDARNSIAVMRVGRNRLFKGKMQFLSGTIMIKVITNGITYIEDYYNPEEYLTGDDWKAWEKEKSGCSQAFLGKDGGSYYIEWNPRWIRVYLGSGRRIQYEVGKSYNGKPKLVIPSVNMHWSFPIISFRPGGGTDQKLRWVEFKDDNRHVMCKQPWEWALQDRQRLLG